MADSEKKHIAIDTSDDLDYLVDRSVNGPQFAESFTFADRDLFVSFLESLKIDYTEFEKRYFYFDRTRNLHVSESEFGYIWISTYGLVAREPETTNSFLNACLSQYVVIKLIFDKAVELIDDLNTYDVDRYQSGYLGDINRALFHNVIFYVELFGKAYLSLSGSKVPHTHSLVKIYEAVEDLLYKRNHNDTVFQAEIIAEFEKLRRHVASIPGGFREEYVKYDDNSEDHTVIVFDTMQIAHIRDVLARSNDFIYDYYHKKDDAIYLNAGLLRRLLDMATNDEEKEQLTLTYGYMVSSRPNREIS